jgi:hypothetical protein
VAAARCAGTCRCSPTKPTAGRLRRPHEEPVTRFNGFSLWPKIIIGIAAALLVTGLAVRASGALNYIIFGNTEAKRERGNTVVAQEQTKAEANIADATIQTCTSATSTASTSPRSCTTDRRE